MSCAHRVALKKPGAGQHPASGAGENGTPPVDGLFLINLEGTFEIKKIYCMDYEALFEAAKSGASTSPLVASRMRFKIDVGGLAPSFLYRGIDPGCTLICLAKSLFLTLLTFNHSESFMPAQITDLLLPCQAHFETKDYFYNRTVIFLLTIFLPL